MVREILYPLTIIVDKYSGKYSGADFLAWNLNPHDIPEEIFTDGVAEFWENNTLVCGKGNSAEAAIIDLHKKLNNI